MGTGDWPLPRSFVPSFPSPTYSFEVVGVEIVLTGEASGAPALVTRSCVPRIQVAFLTASSMSLQSLGKTSDQRRIQRRGHSHEKYPQKQVRQPACPGAEEMLLFLLNCSARCFWLHLVPPVHLWLLWNLTEIRYGACSGKPEGHKLINSGTGATYSK